MSWGEKGKEGEGKQNMASEVFDSLIEAAVRYDLGAASQS